MRHTSYHRLDVYTGVVEELAFCDIDGRYFGVKFERGSTVIYSQEIALEIVNRWNYINSIQPVHARKFIYWI